MIKLAPLPRSNPIKLTIQVLPDLKEKLDDYAIIYEETYGKADQVTDLIPYMLESFLESDRAVKKARRSLQNRGEKPSSKSNETTTEEPPASSGIRSALSFSKD